MTLQEILADAKTFTDEMEMSLGDNKVKLGDLRGLTAKQQKDLSDKIQSATDRERTATEMATKASEIYNNLDALQKKALESQPKQPTGDSDDWETNEWWKPARTRLSSFEKQQKETMDKLTTLATAVERAATIWAEDRWNSQYERAAPRLKKNKDYADWDVAKVRDYATTHKLLDGYGFPSIEKAVAELTKANEIEEIKKQAREEGLKEGMNRGRLERMNRPSSASGGRSAGAKKSSVEEHGLEGLGDDVMDDAELMEQLAEAQKAFDPTSLQ
jgi:hypothetical protein